MFLDLFFELRRRQVPVTTHEWMALMRALELGLHESTLDGFYRLARAVLVKDVGHYDAFDQAFLHVFKGIESEALELTTDLLEWLRDPRRFGGLTGEELRRLRELGLDELREQFEARLREQKERHDGGSRWIGTGGTSPFGSGGHHPTGLRIGRSGGRSAIQVAEERRFRDYRKDAVLDVRQIDLALRLLRDLGRDGAPETLDLDETIDRTARNAGDLEVVLAPPRRNRLKLCLLMDVGGSMDPYADRVSRLFTAASRAGRFARFRSYYFHNCIYESVYEDARFHRAVPVTELLATSDSHERLVVVGDAAMHPSELLDPGGSIYFYTRNPTPGLEWMRRIAARFSRRAWLNPDPEAYWSQTTVRILGTLFPMYPLTIDGLTRAVRHLSSRGPGSTPPTS